MCGRSRKTSRIMSCLQQEEGLFYPRWLSNLNCSVWRPRLNEDTKRKIFTKKQRSSPLQSTPEGSPGRIHCPPLPYSWFKSCGGQRWFSVSGCWSALTPGCCGVPGPDESNVSISLMGWALQVLLRSFDGERFSCPFSPCRKGVPSPTSHFGLKLPNHGFPHHCWMISKIQRKKAEIWSCWLAWTKCCVESHESFFTKN